MKALLFARSAARVGGGCREQAGGWASDSTTKRDVQHYMWQVAAPNTACVGVQVSKMLPSHSAGRRIRRLGHANARWTHHSPFAMGSQRSCSLTSKPS